MVARRAAPRLAGGLDMRLNKQRLKSRKARRNSTRTHAWTQWFKEGHFDGEVASVRRRRVIL
jgi:hypothetical protein